MKKHRDRFSFPYVDHHIHSLTAETDLKQQEIDTKLSHDEGFCLAFSDIRAASFPGSQLREGSSDRPFLTMASSEQKISYRSQRSRGTVFTMGLII